MNRICVVYGLAATRSRLSTGSDITSSLKVGESVVVTVTMVIMHTLLVVVCPTKMKKLLKM